MEAYTLFINVVIDHHSSKTSAFILGIACNMQPIDRGKMIDGEQWRVFTFVFLDVVPVAPRVKADT